MKCKRLFSLFLAAALAVGMALPAGAVNSSFSDVTLSLIHISEPTRP